MYTTTCFNYGFNYTKSDYTYIVYVKCYFQNKVEQMERYKVFEFDFEQGAWNKI